MTVLTLLFIAVLGGWVFTVYCFNTTLESTQTRHLEMVGALHRSHAENMNAIHAMVRDRDDDIRALTQSLALSKEAVPVVFPSRKPLEPASGWYDARPRIIATPDQIRAAERHSRQVGQ